MSDSAPTRPAPTAGMHHVALFVGKFDETRRFYTELMGMSVEWEPDADNVYLCSGTDNLALHRYRGGDRDPAAQRLDHIGFIARRPEDVDRWHDYLKAHDVTMKTAPRTHRDGARSFYCADPDGNTVQIIYHPPISGKL